VTTFATLEADAVKYGPTALQAASIALAIIGVGGAPAAVLAGVEAVLKALTAGVAAGTSPSDISTELGKLGPDLGMNDNAADKAVDDKFGV
jgi:predicted secreted Zn-dependent protease